MLKQSTNRSKPNRVDEVSLFFMGEAPLRGAICAL